MSLKLSRLSFTTLYRTGPFVAAIMGILVGAGTDSPAAAAVKGQYIAKAYTEALGRLPDQPGWLNAINLFASQGCGAATMKSFVRGIYLSTEFTNLGYDNAAKLLTLYRGALNREPMTAEYSSNLMLLNTGTSWTTMVDSFLNGTEFITAAITRCNAANYGFGTSVPIQPPVGGTGFVGNQAQLQAAIDGTPSGGTVTLAQKAVIFLSSPLILKAGVTLTTFGNPDPRHYASMARLVRSSNFPDAMIRMLSGSKLKNVWVDGGRSSLGFNFASVNVQIWGGNGTLLSGNRMGNTAGGTNLSSLGTHEGHPCASNTISSNLIDAYTSSHSEQKWSDGLTIACENALIEFNEIVDASDVAIVVFGAPPSTQRSIVRFNTILNVGNSSYGGLGFDSWKEQGLQVNFTGASIHNNLLWTGPSVHYDIGLAVGTRPWHGNSTHVAFGASMLNNSSGISKINVDLGISVSGMLNATVQGNTLDMTHLNVNSCPTVDVAAAINAGWASGSIQGPYTNTDVTSCVSH